ncbi:MAG: hypothetical protein LC740_01240 [Actinobacteria bacterium]|nr:hypothetical protein [Actinomycetota bacterium]
MSEFEKAVREGVLILTDGGIETRIMFETDIPLAPYVQVAALVTDQPADRCCAEATEATSTPPARSACR